MRKSSIEEESKGKISNSYVQNNLGRTKNQPDPSVPYNIDASASPHALQLALKNMKERYQKVQKKIGLLEEENTQLLGGKSELFGEIGKMQENSIKLREKNLKLNQEIHDKHYECCSLKEESSKLAKKNLELSAELAHFTVENRALTRKINNMESDTESVKKNILKLISRYDTLPADFLLQLKSLVRNLSANPVMQKQKVIVAPKTDANSSYEDFEQICISGESLLMSSNHVQNLNSIELYSLDHIQETMELATMRLQQQQEELLTLRDSLQHQIDSSDDDDQDEFEYQSRLATCNSVIPSRLSSGPELVEHSSQNVPQSIAALEGDFHYKWRNIRISDVDDPKPSTRTVSTSPDPTLHPPEPPDDDRTCPMCNAIFPILVSQETFESHVVAHFESDNLVEGAV